jgi:hypothetical protein
MNRRKKGKISKKMYQEWDWYLWKDEKESETVENNIWFDKKLFSYLSLHVFFPMCSSLIFLIFRAYAF